MMKKTIAAVSALLLMLTLLPAFALVPVFTGSLTDPFSLVSIKVTDAAGYEKPYLAIDNANAYMENQVAYVVFAIKIKSKSDEDHIASLKAGSRTITITSSTLDLSMSASTAKLVWVSYDGSILPGVSISNMVTTEDSGKIVFDIPIDAGKQPASDYRMGYGSFLAVTKPAVSGEIKADLTNDLSNFTEIAPLPLPVYAGTSLARESYVYSSNVLKYIIRTDATNHNFVVYTKSGDIETPLFAYRNSTLNNSFLAIVHEDSTQPEHVVMRDASGKLTYINASGTTVDISAVVNTVNSYFGFSFANSAYPVLEKHFESKSSGAHTIVTDTYAYVTAVVNDRDEEVDVAQTGDYSANIVIVMAACAILAAAALAFVAKKAPD